MSSVFSRKITMFTFSGCFTGEGTPLKYCTGRRQTKRSSNCRSATLSDRIPPPTGVVSGPLIPTRYSRNASTVSSGNHESNLSLAAWPANTSNQAIFFLPPNAFFTADEWNDRLVRRIQPVGPGNFFAIRRSDVFVRHTRQTLSRNYKVEIRNSNGASGTSDMAGKAARAAVERCGSNRDTMERRVPRRQGATLRHTDGKAA